MASGGNNIVELGINKRRFSSMVYGNQVFCFKPNTKSWIPTKLWSTASFEVKSIKSNCIIHENVNITDLESARKRSLSLWNSIIQTIWTKIQQYQASSSDNCLLSRYIPIYSKYCIDVEIDGELEVDYLYSNIDFVCVTACAIGIILFYSSNKLANYHGFHYFSGVSVGLLGSALLLLIILYKIMPKKSAVLGIGLLGGSSFIAWFYRYIYYNFTKLHETLQICIIGYIVGSAVISLTYSYYKGPITNPRAISILKIFLQIASLGLIYWGFTDVEFAFALLMGLFAVTYLWDLNYKNLINYVKPDCINRFFPKKRKLLTQAEYEKEGHEFTLKALQDLKAHCTSPEANPWKLVNRVKSPEKLARFIEEDIHVSDEEMIEYDMYAMDSDLIEDEDDTECNK